MHAIILKLNYLLLIVHFVSFRKHELSCPLKRCVYLSDWSVTFRFFSSNCFESPFDFPTGKGRENKPSSFVSPPNNWGFAWYFVKILGSFCEMKKSNTNCHTLVSLYYAKSDLSTKHEVENKAWCFSIICENHIYNKATL